MSRPRVILIEDEPLVALMMEGLLTDLGCEIAASFDSLSPALSWLAAQVRRPDGAVLDVNLSGGEMVFPFAHALRELGVPFVFVTGCDILPSEGFDDAPLILKPVDPGKLIPMIKAFGAAA